VKGNKVSRPVVVVVGGGAATPTRARVCRTPNLTSTAAVRGWDVRRRQVMQPVRLRVFVLAGLLGPATGRSSSATAGGMFVGCEEEAAAVAKPPAMFIVLLLPVVLGSLTEEEGGLLQSSEVLGALDQAPR
jgi:hypothetical protein